MRHTLVIEPEQVCLPLLARSLMQVNDVDVVLARTCDEALNAFDRRQFDTVILNASVRSPRQSWVLQEMRSRGAQVEIVDLSSGCGEGSEEDTRRFVDLMAANLSAHSVSAMVR